ncbi:MAG: ExbD/TolR family protein [Planctomycetota bacterium]|jgi:biopolymer transport protein ExbD
MGRRRTGPPGIHANLTPMIDVTFLLIVFFVVVSQIVEAEHVELDLPVLLDPAAEPPGEDARAIVSIVPGIDGRAAGYRLGGDRFDADRLGRRSLESAIARRLRAQPTLRLNLRADRESRYDEVRPVLETIGRAARQVPGASPRVHLVLVPEDEA